MLRRPTSALRRFFGALLCGPAAFSFAAARADDAPAAPPSAPAALITSMRENVLRMTNFFDTTLPGTLAQYNLVIEFQPKFSDLRANEFIRYPLLLRYGLAKHWELFGGITPFNPNPFNSGFDHRWGLGDAQLGVRHDVGRIPGVYDEITVGVEVDTPLGQPPVILNDHYTHVVPTISASRKLPWPYTRFLTEYSYDRQVGPEITNPPPGVVHRNVIQIAPGVLYKPGEFGAFADYTFRHFSEDIGSHLGHEAQVGGLWDVPLARTSQWGLPGKWQVELAFRYTTEEGVGHTAGVIARVHWRTTLHEMLRQVRP
jgi:hypothetical protein